MGRSSVISSLEASWVHRTKERQRRYRKLPTPLCSPEAARGLNPQTAANQAPYPRNARTATAKKSATIRKMVKVSLGGCERDWVQPEECRKVEWRNGFRVDLFCGRSRNLTL